VLGPLPSKPRNLLSQRYTLQHCTAAPVQYSAAQYHKVPCSCGLLCQAFETHTVPRPACFPADTSVHCTIQYCSLLYFTMSLMVPVQASRTTTALHIWWTPSARPRCPSLRRFGVPLEEMGLKIVKRGTPPQGRGVSASPYPPPHLSQVSLPLCSTAVQGSSSPCVTASQVTPPVCHSSPGKASPHVKALQVRPTLCCGCADGV